MPAKKKKNSKNKSRPGPPKEPSKKDAEASPAPETTEDEFIQVVAFSLITAFFCDSNDSNEEDQQSSSSDDDEEGGVLIRYQSHDSDSDTSHSGNSKDSPSAGTSTANNVCLSPEKQPEGAVGVAHQSSTQRSRERQGSVHDTRRPGSNVK